jgi:hypothetical protein
LGFNIKEMEYLVDGSEDKVLILNKGIIKCQINLDIQGLEKKRSI